MSDDSKPRRRGRWASGEDYADQQARTSYLPDIHRLLPQSPEAELGVLSCCFMSPVEMASYCAIVKVRPDHFHIPAHQEVFRCMMTMVAEGVKVDFISLAQRLRDANKFEAVGGASFITSLGTYLATATNAGYYLGILQEKKVLRDIIEVCTHHAALAYDEQDEVPKLMSEFESKALAIRENATSQKTISTKDVVMEAVGDIQRLYECRGAITGLECGFPGIDMVLDGLQPEMIVIAARPSQGKTALAMGMAEHIAIVGLKPVGVFSLEMSAKQLMKRSIASIAQVNLRALQQGFLAERDFPAITAAANALQKAPLFIDDAAGLTIDELRGRARRWRFEKKVEAIFIDYLQLIRGTSKRAAENRQEEIREVSAGLKAMTKELGIPIVVLAQISRQFEQRGPMARPRLSDLKESGAIEQDADSVSFLVRRETAAETDEERQELAGQAELIIAKQRNGPLGDVPLTFIKEFTRFESRAEGNFEEADAVAAREQEKERQRAKDRAENDLPM